MNPRRRFRQLALKIIAGVTFLLVFMGFLQPPGTSDPGREGPGAD